MNKLTDAQIRSVYKAILRFGNIEDRFEELIADGTLPNKNVSTLSKCYEDMLQKSKEQVAEYEEKKTAILKELEADANAEKEANSKLPPTADGKSHPTPKLQAFYAKRREKKAILIDYRGVKNLNAETIINRPQEMKLLKSFIPEENPMAFRFQKDPKPVHGWTCQWTSIEDTHLLIGIFKFGYGAWTQIRDDPILNLQNKMFLETAPAGASKEEKDKINKRSPGAVHLVRRADYLFSFLKDLSTGGTETRDSSSALRDIKKPPRVRKKINKSSTPDTDSKNGTPKPNGRGSHSSNGSPYSQPTLQQVLKKLPSKPAAHAKHSSHPHQHPPLGPKKMQQHTPPRHPLLRSVEKDLRMWESRGKGLEKNVWTYKLKVALIHIGEQIEKVSKNNSHLNRELWEVAQKSWPNHGVKADLIKKMYIKKSSK
ncbi:unnamed protein product [Ambrosiozyma monospora]|uniref:Unnamed protein product n=1 Tax=Ambrosiozyma monospora TaxID=43982 RepID=A0ACB5SRU9_AMBMO|nr:unnamed protein product [Ambrosiozyma monospora]